MAQEKSKPATFRPKAAEPARDRWLKACAVSASTSLRSAQAIVAGGEEIKEAEVAENLQLLPDFVADVEVLRMKSCQRANVAIYVGESEFGLA